MKCAATFFKRIASPRLRKETRRVNVSMVKSAGMEKADLKDYIFAQEQNREALTINRFFADRLSFLGLWFARTLKWELPYVWLGFRIPHKRLLKGFDCPSNRFLGDVDVFGACLETSSLSEYQEYWSKSRSMFPSTADPTQVQTATIQTMIEDGKAKWPPSLSYITAAEVKAAYFNARAELKGSGDKYNGRAQALELCKMGFDRVGLVRFVVTEPISSGIHHPWTAASARSAMAMDDYTDESKGIFVTNEDPYGTMLISTGAVLGNLEHMAGGTSGEWFREPPDNPYRKDSCSVRDAINVNLFELFTRYEFPKTFPVLVLACSDEKCAELYVSGANPNAMCPNCGRPPR